MKNRRNYTYKRRRIYGGNTERLQLDTYLIYTIRKGNLEKIRRIVEDNPASVNIKGSGGKTPLIYAVQSNNIDIVKYIISAGANINEKGGGSRPITQALLPRINNDIFDEILKENPDLNFKPNVLSLSMRVKSQSYKINELLSRIDVNSVDEEIPLISALKYNATRDIIDRIIDLTTNINISDKSGNTPLHYSINSMCMSDLDIDITEKLLTKGANVNIKNMVGDTPLFNAMRCLSFGIDIIDGVISAGANINEINNNGDNILTVALSNYDIYDYLADLTLDTEKIITHGININHKNNDGLSALHFVAENINSIQFDTANITLIIKFIDLLVENGAKISDDIVSSITNRYIRNYLKNKYDEQRLVNTSAVKWKGFTRGDLEKLNTIFDPSGNPANVSMCPVCLKYVERSEACNYMTHDCSTEGYYHRNLFDKYKNTHNHVSWCTLCGRICRGHNHYPLSSVDDPVPNVIIGTDPFAKDCRVDGGGGLEEKIMRFRTMREYTKRLQLEVGKISHEAAMNELVEAMWNPGMMQRIVSNIIRNKKFNISINEFPEHIERNAITSAPPNSYMTPKVLGKGTNSFTFEEDIPVLMFAHKNRAGQMVHHDESQAIGKDMLIDYIKGSATQDNRCYVPGCNGYLWPEEVEAALENLMIKPSVSESDRNIAAAYHERFYPIHNTSGGGSTNVFLPALNATCELPRKKTNGGRYKSRKNRGARVYRNNRTYKK